jgi:branched-chain amino acid transport system permease protein
VTSDHFSSIALVTSIDVLMAVAFYLPMATGALFVVPIGAMGIGAYVSAELAIHGSSLGVDVLGAAGAGGAAALGGGLIVVRMRAWSAAIASLAIVEVIQAIFQNYSPIGGASGLYGVPLFTPLTTAITICLAVVVALVALELTRIGDVWEAIRSDDLAAACSGLRVRLIRLTTFVTSGAVAGVAGALLAGFLGFVDPSTFGFAQLNNYLIATILGGSTTAAGSLVGGITVNALPEIVRFAARYTILVLSLLVIVVMLVRREGVISRRAIKRLARGTMSVVHLRPERMVARPTKRPVPRRLRRRPAWTTLSAQRIYKSFGGVDVLRDVSIALNTGEVMGIIGANGAGKTTLVNVITGVIRADSGQVLVAGPGGERVMRRLTPSRATGVGIARTFQHGRLFPGLTTREHMSLIPGTDADELLLTVGLEHRADVLASSLSYGEQRLVEIGRALATAPRFLILDEPAAGMSSEEAHRVAQTSIALAERGVGLLIIDHNVEFIAAVCTSMVAMDFGEVVAAGTPAEVIRNPRVVEAYLGESPAEVSIG